MKAVILAGGLGTRLRPLTNNTPKPMLPIGEKPILEHLINWTKKNGVKSIVLCVSYLKETIEDYFEDGEKFGVKIEYAISKKQLATAGQLKTAEKFIDGDFVCMYGDSLFNFNLKNMIKQHAIKKAMKRKSAVNSFITKKGFSDIGNKESYKKACEEYDKKSGKN